LGFIFKKRKEIKKYKIIFLIADIPFESSTKPITNKRVKITKKQIISRFRKALK
jgi:hypothetical protein